MPSRRPAHRRGAPPLVFDLAAVGRLTAKGGGSARSRVAGRLGTDLLGRVLAELEERSAVAIAGLLAAPERRGHSPEPEPFPALAAAPARITCLVVDDHPIVREAICRVLARNEIEVVGTAADGEEAVRKMEDARPDVALVDLRIPKVDGKEVARRAARVAPETAVVLYTGADPPLLGDALCTGARGLVLKEAPIGDIVRAVKTVAAGGMHVDPALARVLAECPATAGLTSRELDVLRLLAEGRTDEGAAGALGISRETVRTHVRKAMLKLQAKTRTAAVATALRQRMIA